MIISLGEFKFKSKTPINSIKTSLNANLTAVSRINNIPAYFAATLPTRSITIDGATLPKSTSGLKSLDQLRTILVSQMARPLTTGYGDYLGEFVLTEISDERSAFLPSGEFLGQTFSLKLELAHE